MTSIEYYESPLGRILLSSDELGLTGLWFDGEKYYPDNLHINCVEQETAILKEAKLWLDIYFSGREPDFVPPLHPQGSAFRLLVWKHLLDIPYGKTTTYGDIACKVAAEKGIERMSSQAIGGAAAHNAISIIIPCHRVTGANGHLTGYAGGIERKAKLLELERCLA